MSSLNTGSINTSYPNPGVNNSSQGFRDNFAAIKTNLDTTKTELEDLQGKVLVKTALTGTTMDNDMAGGQISNVLTKGFRNTVYDLGANLSNNIDIDLTKGDVQTGTVTGDITLSFSKWSPSGTRSTVEAIFTVTPGRKIQLPDSITYGLDTIEGYDSASKSIIIPAGVTRVHLSFTSIDCGTTIAVEPVDTPRVTRQIKTGTPPKDTVTGKYGSVGDCAGDIMVNETHLYICTKKWGEGVNGGGTWSKNELGTTNWS